jgi:hypothetical protein
MSLKSSDWDKKSMEIPNNPTGMAKLRLHLVTDEDMVNETFRDEASHTLFFSTAARLINNDVVSTSSNPTS